MKYIVYILLIISLLLITTESKANTIPHYQTYLPLIQQRPPDPQIEFRGVWVNRFDWTTPDAPAAPEKIDEIIDNIAYAGFNAVFFQMRATADAYYPSDLEPWATRIAGTYGQAPDPFWDPLAYLIEKAHAQNIEVHAYLNVYPITGCNSVPDKTVSPLPLYHILEAAHGRIDNKLTALQWDADQAVACQTYQRVTPASPIFRDHMVNVGKDLATRYALDGIHLDHIRYGIEGASCDPVSEALYGDSCFANPDYGDWQREQINLLVRRFYKEVVPLRDGLWLSAAVWPLHEMNPNWEWPGWPEEGNKLYFQDSKAWVRDGYIHSISPMIYPGGEYSCPDTNYWQIDRWETLVRDFQAGANGRFIIPGIGSDYCTFDEIAARIELSRQIGTQGHALFSYHGLLKKDYFDDLAEGPYRVTAVTPKIINN